VGGHRTEQLIKETPRTGANNQQPAASEPATSSQPPAAGSRRKTQDLAANGGYGVAWGIGYPGMGLGLLARGWGAPHGHGVGLRNGEQRDGEMAENDEGVEIETGSNEQQHDTE
jgi:hypothetical protein